MCRGKLFHPLLESTDFSRVEQSKTLSADMSEKEGDAVLIVYAITAAGCFAASAAVLIFRLRGGSEHILPFLISLLFGVTACLALFSGYRNTVNADAQYLIKTVTDRPDSVILLASGTHSGKIRWTAVCPDRVVTSDTRGNITLRIRMLPTYGKTRIEASQNRICVLIHISAAKGDVPYADIS